jgi:hypothetical protein
LDNNSPSYNFENEPGGYEEIGGSNEENPWSIGHQQKNEEVEVQHTWNTQQDDDDDVSNNTERKKERVIKNTCFILGPRRRGSCNRGS